VHHPCITDSNSRGIVYSDCGKRRGQVVGARLDRLRDGDEQVAVAIEDSSWAKHGQ